ncbi:hypothetical protein B0I21_11813 [Sphingobacterium paludis]|uniref:Uncharacterized protein n=1 Tax=Sphingobacterium paludis TaxID=1476465 RepID=A0A4R7CRV5_9SPHI|nr:hypothetical protein B0I21_11813 [Sphingobacterium paludis]
MMDNSITIVALINLVKASVRIGLGNAILQHNILLDLLTKTEAYKRYGRSNIDRLLKENLICGSNSGNRRVLLRKELDQIAAKSNRTTYLTAKERK